MNQQQWNTVHTALLTFCMWAVFFTAGVWVGKSYLPSINDWKCTRHTTVVATDPDSGEQEVLMVCVERTYVKEIEGEIK